MIALDLTGQKFGRLVVASFAGRRTIGGETRRLWLCQCDCGHECTVAAKSLLIGYTTSCGCAKVVGVTSHGKAGTAEHSIWKSMNQRCSNPNDTGYPRYGARGIKVCERWRDSFENFLADMGPRPDPKLTLERVDNEASYAPDNCVWATRTAQILNTRPKNTNRSGIVGVHWNAKEGKWRAQISINYKKIALGRFTRIEDAKGAYDKALAARKASI